MNAPVLYTVWFRASTESPWQPTNIKVTRTATHWAWENYQKIHKIPSGYLTKSLPVDSKP